MNNQPVHSLPCLPEDRIVYFKRYKMECELDTIPAITLPTGYHWHPWHETLINTHGEVLFSSFDQEIDADVFESLGDAVGCRCLISTLAQRSDFLAESTWLLSHDNVHCGTIQALREGTELGAIQNVGIIPEYRGKGLGALLVLKALESFRSLGMKCATLEVTALNQRAVDLYRRLGFKRRKTIYKAVVRKECRDQIDDSVYSDSIEYWI